MSKDTRTSRTNNVRVKREGLVTSDDESESYRVRTSRGNGNTRLYGDRRYPEGCRHCGNRRCSDLRRESDYQSRTRLTLDRSKHVGDSRNTHNHSDTNNLAPLPRRSSNQTETDTQSQLRSKDRSHSNAPTSDDVIYLSSDDETVPTCSCQRTPIDWSHEKELLKEKQALLDKQRKQKLERMLLRMAQNKATFASKKDTSEEPSVPDVEIAEPSQMDGAELLPKIYKVSVVRDEFPKICENASQWEKTTAEKNDSQIKAKETDQDVVFVRTVELTDDQFLKKYEKTHKELCSEIARPNYLKVTDRFEGVPISNSQKRKIKRSVSVKPTLNFAMLGAEVKLERKKPSLHVGFGATLQKNFSAPSSKSCDTNKKVALPAFNFATLQSDKQMSAPTQVSQIQEAPTPLPENPTPRWPFGLSPITIPMPTLEQKEALLQPDNSVVHHDRDLDVNRSSEKL